MHIMFSLNPTKKFDANNHPFILGIKGECYRTFTDYSGRKGHEMGALSVRRSGVFTATYVGGRPKYTDKLGDKVLPTTAAEKAAYFAGRFINSIFSVPFHLLRTIIDISL